MNIKTLSFRYLISVVCIAAGMSCLALSAMGQAVRRPATARPVSKATSKEVRIRKMDGLGSRGKVRTPVFRVSPSRGSIKPPGEWIQITVEYSTTPDWIDELVFQYHVITETRIEGKTVYSLFQNTVRYGDIEKDTRHFSTMFLRPATVERFGEPIGMAVEISYKSKVVAADADTKGGSGLPEGEWWKNPKVLEDPRVVKRAGYLLNRAETPFALINMDDHEVIR